MNLRNLKKRKRSIKNHQINRNELTATDNNMIAKKKSSVILLILLYILSVSIIGGLVFLIIKFMNPKKKITDDLVLKKDNLIINIKYPTNLYMRFISRKHTSILAEGGGIDQDKANNDFSQISDFIFIVRDNQTETDIVNKTEKELYNAYIAFLNITLKNETNDMIMIYDKQLNEYLNKQNLRRLEQEDDTNQAIINEGIICFVKFEFYQNGIIKNYFIPKNFSKNDFIYIKIL